MDKDFIIYMALMFLAIIICGYFDHQYSMEKQAIIHHAGYYDKDGKFKWNDTQAP